MTQITPSQICWLSAPEVVCFGVALLLAGCSTTYDPNYSVERIYAPVTSGVLLKSSVPEAGVSLVMSLVDDKTDLCHFSTLRTTTDENGEFNFEALTSELAGARAGNLELQWQVCIDAEPRIGIWHEELYGAILVPSSSQLECDLSSPPGSICIETSSTER